MSRTRSVSEACAVSAARPITKATAAGPAFVREIKLSEQIGGSCPVTAGSDEVLSFMSGRFALPRAGIVTLHDPFTFERTCS